MFSCIIAGRPVITEFQTISPTQFAFNIPAQPQFSHLGVFLLPGQVLDPQAAAAVYIQIPPSADFKLLGAIANEKQSAIFRVNGGPASKNGTTQNDDAMLDDGSLGQSQSIGGPNIVVGISVEPAANIRAQLDAIKSQNISAQINSGNNSLVVFQQQPVNTKILAQRIIKNAFNFLSSFSGGSSGNEVVPLKSFQDWWTKFEKKIELDPTFLEREEAN